MPLSIDTTPETPSEAQLAQASRLKAKASRLLVHETMTDAATPYAGLERRFVEARIMVELGHVPLVLEARAAWKLCRDAGSTGGTPARRPVR